MADETALIAKPYLDRLAGAQNKKNAEKKNWQKLKKEQKKKKGSLGTLCSLIGR